jgi:hypothetical protein
MSTPARTRLLPLVVAVLGASPVGIAARPAAAQHNVSIRADAPDSVSWIVRRQPPDLAEAALRSRDRHVALLLTDTTLVLQLTDLGLDHITDRMDDEPGGLGARLVARMLGAGITGLLDHGIAYRLSALRAARREGSALVLEDRDGHHLFEDVEINGRHVMNDFPAADAERFAAAVNRAVRQQR